MINLCGCTGVSASKLELPRNQEVAECCKICGGKALVDRQGPLPGSMLSTVGLELSRVLNPQFNWKNSKGKPRAVRRARSSFTGGNKKKPSEKSSKGSEDLSDKDSKRTGEMPVSESEKLGVTILGRRFSDTIESVPIKKRRFLLVRSPSPPPCSPSPSDESEHISVSQSASYQRGPALNSNTGQELLKIKNVVRTKLDEERIAADEMTNLDDVDEKLCDSADFSGISILAAAACNSSIGDDVINGESSVFKGHPCEREGSLGNSEISESHSVPENKLVEERVLNTAQISDSKADIPSVRDATFMLSSKGQAEIKMGGSQFPEGSLGSLQNVPDKSNGTLRRAESSLRDDRFHWDLNTVMDAWESPCDDIIVDSQPLAATLNVEDGSHDGKLDKKELYEERVGDGYTKSATECLNDKVVLGSLPVVNCGTMNIVQVKADLSCTSSVADHDDDLPQEEKRLGGATAFLADLAEEAKSFNNQGLSSITTDAGSSPVWHAADPVRGSPSANGCAFEEEKADTPRIGLGPLVETEIIPSHLRSSGNTGVELSVHACEAHPSVDQISSEMVSEEKTFAGSKADHNTHRGLSDAQMGKYIHIGSPQSEKHSHFHPNPKTCKINDHSVEPVAEQVSSVLVDGVICTKKMAGDGEMGGEAGWAEPFDEEKSNIIHQPIEVDRGACPSDSLTHTSQGLPNCEEIASGCMTKDEWATVEVRLQGTNSSMLADENLNGTEIGHHIHIASKDSLTPSVVDAHPLMDALSSHDTHKCFVDDLVNSPVENALDDHFDCDYDSDASQNDIDQAVGMEKVDHQGDDDSQYEDGELRESVMHCLVEVEEGEAEHVDYGSDVFDADSDYPTSSISLHGDSVECKNGGPLGDGNDHLGEDHNGEKDVQEDVPRPFPDGSSVANASDIVSVNKGAVSIVRKVPRGGHSRREKLERVMKDAPEFDAVNDKVVGDREFLAEGVGARELSHSAGLRMKSSGWDRLPEGCKSFGDIVVDNAERKHGSVSLDALGAGESLRRLAGSTLRRDLSSRIESPKSSDGSHRKDRAYLRGTRSREHPNDLHHSVERDAGLGRSIGRGGSSVHIHGRGRGRGRGREGDHWVESSSHWSPSRHDMPDYYSPAGFTHSNLKNAAAASTAKVESNGFVVAPDGTVVEAGGAGPSRRLPRRSANASSHSTRHSLRGRRSPTERDEALIFGTQLGLQHTRDMSPDRRINIGRGRAGRYGPRMVNTGHRERYQGLLPDDGIGSALPMHHPFSRRERSFSPQRRSLHVYRSDTRSPSRSGTRSPHTWTSPRGQSRNGMNGGLRRRSRSPPNFRSEARFERMRSPHRRSGFAERMAGFAPTSRNHASSPHASRWIDERKNLPEHFRDHEYKRSSRRSPPARPFSRSHRFDTMDSPGRLKPDGYYRSVHSGRFTEFGIGKGPRIDDSDDDRRHGDKYEMLPSERQYDILGDFKRFRYDTEDVFRPHNDRPKNAPEFHGRGSPRGFDRGMQSQLCISPHRVREEKGQFRYGREGKHNASFKSFGMRDCDEDLTPRRRRAS